MRAKANYTLNNYDEAIKDFRKVGTEVTSIEGAESKYRIAELLYKTDQNKNRKKLFRSLSIRILLISTGWQGYFFFWLI